MKPGNVQGNRGAIGDKGFTLMELLVTTLIAALMAAVSIPSFFQWRENIEYRQATRGIVSHLRYARSRAISMNREHRVEFKTASRTYGLREGDRAINTNWDKVPPISVWETCPTAVNLSTNVHSIQFNTNGTANGGTITVRDQDMVKRYDIIVARTGRIRIQ